MGKERLRKLARCLKLTNEPMDPFLKIVIVDKNPIRAAILEDGLPEAGRVQGRYQQDVY